jgi:hypothetical protein
VSGVLHPRTSRSAIGDRLAKGHVVEIAGADDTNRRESSHECPARVLDPEDRCIRWVETEGKYHEALCKAREIVLRNGHLSAMNEILDIIEAVIPLTAEPDFLEPTVGDRVL